MSRVSSSSVSDARKITKRQPKRRNRCLKPLLAAAFAVPVIGSFGTASAVLYWDSNGTTAGTASTSGSWSESKWSTDSNGLIATGAWATDSAVFSAGTNGTGAFTITIDGGSRNTSAGLTVEEGTVTFNTTAAANIVAMGAGTLTIKTGAILAVDNASGFFETSHTLGGGGVILDGGTLRNTNASAGSTFYSANATIGLGTGGTGAIDLSGGVAIIWQGAGLIGTSGSGATTANGGAGTLTKSGTGEFRFQSSGTAASTYQKLVVTGGLFRTGSTAGSSELGFGAAPTASLADAITLNGGGIGTTASTTLHSNRGITIGASGGNISTIGTLVIPGLLSGSGQFTQTAGSTTLSNAGNNASFTGSLNMAGGTLTLSQSLTATQLTASVTTATVSIATSRTLTVGSNDASTNYNGLISGAGTFTKVGNGTITLAPAAEWSNTGGVIISAGSLRFNAGAMGFASGVTVTVNGGGTLDMNNINDTFGALSGTAGGLVTAGTGNITLAGTQSTTYNGTISGSGTFQKAATSTGLTTLTGSNTAYTGAITVSAGRLGVGSADALGTTAVGTTILSGAEALFNNVTVTTAEPFTIAGIGGSDNGAIATAGTSVATVSGPVTLTAATQLAVTGTSTLSFTNPNAITGTNVNLTLQGGAGIGGGGTISGIIALGTGGVTKLQGGKWTLSGDNSFTGPTAISAGTLEAAATLFGDESLGGTSSVSVSGIGASLLLGADDEINDLATFSLTSGTINTDGFSEGSFDGFGDGVAGVGALTVAADPIIDMGSNLLGSILAFADSSGATWTGTTLSIYNWTGTPVVGGGFDRLFFGNDAAGLTPAQLSMIVFYSDAGLTPYSGFTATILDTGEVVPAPEPASLALIGLAGVSMLGRRKRR